MSLAYGKSFAYLMAGTTHIFGDDLFEWKGSQSLFDVVVTNPLDSVAFAAALEFDYVANCVCHVKTEDDSCVEGMRRECKSNETFRPLFL